MIAVKKIGRHV